MKKQILIGLNLFLFWGGLFAQSSPYQIVVVDNTCYSPGSPIFSSSGYLCVSHANYSMYRDFVYMGTGFHHEMVQPSRSAPLPKSFSIPLNEETVTLNELISTRRKDFSFHRGEYNGLMSSVLSHFMSTEIVLNDSLLAPKQCQSQIFSLRSSDPLLKTTGETPGSIQAIEKGLYDKEELRRFVADHRESDLLMILDTCWLGVDLCSAYSSRKTDRNTSGDVVLSMYSVWDIYMGDDLQHRLVLPPQMDTVHQSWQDIHLYGKLPKLKDLSSLVLEKSVTRTLEELKKVLGW